MMLRYFDKGEVLRGLALFMGGWVLAALLLALLG